MPEAARVTAEFSGIEDEAEGSDWRVRLHDPVARIYLDGRLAAENTRFPFSPEDVRARAGRIGAGLSGPGFIGLGYNPIGAIIGLVGATAAVLCWWFALRGHVAESRKRMGFSGLGGIIFAVVGFTGGIAGPMILAPNANQGPLLGIFITGPLGFVAGAVGGWLYACLRPRRPSVPPES